MSRLLAELTTALRTGAIQVIDLTAPLSEDTPIIQLPPERGQPWPFSREVISNFDHLGPQVYWNNIRLSEHTGTHFDSPSHWLSGKGSQDVSQVPPGRLVGPAAVIDMTAEVAKNDDFLLEREHVEAWIAEHGPLPEGGWLLYRTGWDARKDDQQEFLNNKHTPGVSEACAKWLAEETALIGFGVETVGTDAGLAGEFDQPYPCHWFMHGAGKYGLTQLRNLALVPATGAVLIVGPLPIVGGSGSPARALALVEARNDGDG